MTTPRGHIELNGIAKRYGELRVLHDLALEIRAGELFVLLGASGCGKTTLLKIIAGLTTQDSGEILVDGAEITRLPPERRNVVYLFQKPTLFDFMNVRDNIGFGLKIRGMDRAEIDRRVDDCLNRIDLPGYGERKPSELSGGQAQRVALARALVVEPRVLLLDEPLSSLDASIRDEMRQLIRSVNRESSITMIMVTHDQMEAAVMGDRIGLMIDGAIEQVGTPRTLFNAPANERVATFLRQSLFEDFTNIVHGRNESTAEDSHDGRL